MTVIPLGINIRMCIASLLLNSLLIPRLGSVSVLTCSFDSVHGLDWVSTHVLPFAEPKRLPEYFLPSEQELPLPESSSLHTYSLGCSRLTSTRMILAFNFRNRLVAVAQLNFLSSFSYSSTYHSGQTPTWWWWCLFVFAETKNRNQGPYIPLGRYVP